MPALRRRQGPVRGGYGVGSGRNAPQGEHPRSRIADMGRIVGRRHRRPAGGPVPRDGEFRSDTRKKDIRSDILFCMPSSGSERSRGCATPGSMPGQVPAAMCFGARFRGFPHRRIRRLQKKGRYATSRPVIPVETRIRLSPRVSYRGDPHRPSRPDRLPCRACCRGTA